MTIQLVQNIFTTVALAALLIGALYFTLSHALDLSEYEDCMKFQAWQQQGHPIVVPEWCDSHLKSPPKLF